MAFFKVCLAVNMQDAADCGGLAMCQVKMSFQSVETSKLDSRVQTAICAH